MKRPLVLAALLMLAVPAAWIWFDRPLALACAAGHCAFGGLPGVLSAMGNSAWVLVLAGLVLLLRLCGHLRRLADGVVARCREVFWMVVATGLLADLLKGVVARPRPRLLLREGLADPRFFHWFDAAWASMPSGHTVTAFTVAWLVARWWPRLTWPAFALACGVAAARVALGAHFLSDVLCGAALVFLVFGSLRALERARAAAPAAPWAQARGDALPLNA
jgi:undecaprenyl-diphosphatase